jgi:hypothetical protein
MRQFYKLVQLYRKSLVANVLFATRYPGQPIEVQLLLSKLEKHEKNRDLRKMASYLAMFRKDYPKSKMPEMAKDIGKRNGIRYDAINGFGYPHADGGYHYFK